MYATLQISIFCKLPKENKRNKNALTFLLFYLSSSFFFFSYFTFYKVALCFIIFILSLCSNALTLESILNWNLYLKWKVSLFGDLRKLWTIFKDANRLSSSTFKKTCKVLHARQYFWWQRLDGSGFSFLLNIFNRRPTVVFISLNLNDTLWIWKRWKTCQLDVSGVHRKGPQNQNFFMTNLEVYSKPTQTSKIQSFAKIVNGFQLTVFCWLFSRKAHLRGFPRFWIRTWTFQIYVRFSTNWWDHQALQSKKD